MSLIYMFYNSKNRVVNGAKSAHTHKAISFAKFSAKNSLKIVAMFGILSLGTNIFNPLQGLACDITSARAECNLKLIC